VKGGSTGLVRGERAPAGRAPTSTGCAFRPACPVETAAVILAGTAIHPRCITAAVATSVPAGTQAPVYPRADPLTRIGRITGKSSQGSTVADAPDHGLRKEASAL
jgi:hypothetical protein